MKYIKNKSDLLNYAKDETQRQEINYLLTKRSNLELLISILSLICILFSNIDVIDQYFKLDYIINIILIILNFYLLILTINDDIDLTEYSKLNMNQVTFVTSKKKSAFRFIIFIVLSLFFIVLQIKILI